MAERGEDGVVEEGEDRPEAPCRCGVGLLKSGFARDGRQRWMCRGCRKTVSGLAGRVEAEGARDPVLVAYRHVLGNVARWDRSGLEKTARRIHEESPQKFMDRYRELEAAERAGGEGTGEVAVDGAEERVLGLIEAFLRDVRVESGGVLP